MTDSGWFTTPPTLPTFLQMRKCGTDDSITIAIMSPGKYTILSEPLREGEEMDLPTEGYEYRAAMEPNPSIPI